MVKKFNSDHKKRVTLSKIKDCYRTGARQAQKAGESEYDINTWAFANVNLFLSNYLSKSDDSVLGDFFVKANEDIKEYDIDVKYDSIEQLYLEAYTPIETVY